MDSSMLSRYNAAMQRSILTALLVAGTLGLPSASAEERKPQAKSPPQPIICPICHTANNEAAPYPDKAGSTLLRGAVNTAFGWTELLIQPSAELQTTGNIGIGIGKGIGLAVKRTALGFGEMLTFWTPKSPEGYFRLNQDCPICMGRPIQTPPGPSSQSKPPAQPKTPAR